MQYTLFRRRGNDAWFVEWFADGHRHERCLDTADEDSAEARAAGLCAAAAGHHDPAGEAPDADAALGGYTVGHALQDFLDRGCTDNAIGTRRCYLQRAGHLLRILGDVSLVALALDPVQAYIDARLGESASPETVRKELCVLRRALDLAHRRGILDKEPARLMPRFRTRYVPRKTWLTPAQFETLLAKLEPDRQRWLLVAAYSGARLSELQRLRWEDCDFVGAQLHIRGTKTRGSDRFVPIHPRLRELLQAQRAVRGLLLRPWPNVRRDLAVACRAVGVPRITPNDLRRTFASWLVQSGETSYVVSQLLGHGSSTMVERVYGRLSGQSLRDAVAKLPRPAE